MTFCIFFESLINKLALKSTKNQDLYIIFHSFVQKNIHIIQSIIDYLFIETFTKRKITVMVSLRILEKLIRLDQSQKFKAQVYSSLRKPLNKLIEYLRNIDLDIKNINSISVWIENIFTKNFDLKNILLLNLPLVYDFRLSVNSSFCHELFIFENNDNNNKRIYNSIFLFSRIGYFFERNFKSQQKKFNFKRMYLNFYASSPFSKLKESKSYSIDGKESFPAKIKVKIQNEIKSIDV